MAGEGRRNDEEIRKQNLVILPSEEIILRDIPLILVSAMFGAFL